jgi:uncharacterized membrane protein YdjX (TVP38/TMEM64 family)
MILPQRRLAIGLALAIGTAVAIWLLWRFAGHAVLRMLHDPVYFRASVQGVGWWGPLIIVVLRMVTCLIAFLPSSPVVVAAGAAYGPLWGSVFVLCGAQIGSLVTFFIGRLAGRAFLEQRGWVSTVAKTRVGGWLLDPLGSQSRLSLAVLICRLIPGLDLDAITYVAGVTPLSWWRFAVANLAGLAPYTFAFILLGDRLVYWGWKGAAVSLGVLLALFGLAAWLSSRRRSATCETQRETAPTNQG